MDDGLEVRPEVERLSRDVVMAAKDLGPREVRFLVDGYYLLQDERIRVEGQLRSMGDEPNELLGWLAKQSRTLEGQIKRTLDRYSDSQPLGRWARSNVGVGPVIGAGLLAHIDMVGTQVAGRLWSYAGLTPDIKWEKGQKRPWNAALKVICWKMGESFVKFQNHVDKETGELDCYYGQVFIERKAKEIARNEAGDFTDQAEAKLKKYKIGKKTEAYKHYSAGHLPPAHIHARARRYAVKLFLAHYFEVGCRLDGREPPKPYPIAYLDHVHYIPPPNQP